MWWADWYYEDKKYNRALRKYDAWCNYCGRTRYKNELKKECQEVCSAAVTLREDLRTGKKVDIEREERSKYYRMRMEAVQHQIDRDCEEFYKPTSIIFDSSGKPIQGKPAREVWYMNNCGKYMKK